MAICSAEAGIRIASAMAAMVKLNRIWRCNTISFASKFKPLKSLVTSILLYGCETWTLLADSGKRIQALETKCRRTLLRISYLSTKPTTGCGARSTLEWVPRNLFWRLSRDGNLHDWGMSQATTASPKPSIKAHRRGQQRKCWKNNIQEWTQLPMPELLTKASYRKDWKRISAGSSFISPRRPSGSKD